MPRKKDCSYGTGMYGVLSFVDYAPIEDYLIRLPVWDGKDRIRPLAARIPCDNVRWEQLFYTWFLSMVAHWQGRDKQHGNSLFPRFWLAGKGAGSPRSVSTCCHRDLNLGHTFIETGHNIPGSRNQSGLKRILMGSVSQGVLTQSHCPVVIAKAGAQYAPRNFFKKSW